MSDTRTVQSAPDGSLKSSDSLIPSTQSFSENFFDEPSRLLELMNYIWQEFKKKDSPVRAWLVEALTTEELLAFNKSENPAKIIKETGKYYIEKEQIKIKIKPEKMKEFWQYMQGLSPAPLENSSPTNQAPFREEVFLPAKPDKIEVKVVEEIKTQFNTLRVETTFYDERDDDLTKCDVRSMNTNDAYAVFFNEGTPVWVNISSATSIHEIQDMLARKTPKSARQKPKVATIELKAPGDSVSPNLDKENSSQAVNFTQVPPPEAPIAQDAASLSVGSVDDNYVWDESVKLVRRYAIWSQDPQCLGPAHSENKSQDESSNLTAFLHWLRIQLNTISAYMTVYKLSHPTEIINKAKIILNMRDYTNEIKIEKAIELLSTAHVTHEPQQSRDKKFFKARITNQQLTERMSQYHETCMTICLLQVIDGYCKPQKQETSILPKELRERLTKKIHEKMPAIEKAKITRSNYAMLNRSLDQSPDIVKSPRRLGGKS